MSTNMSEIINLEDEFNSWFNEIESFGLRSERFYQELNCYCTRENQAELMLSWLKAAYLHGIKTAAQDSIDTLRDYSTAMYGVKYAVPADLAFDDSANNLQVYWDNVLKDKE